jgi:hypothetical protein
MARNLGQCGLFSAYAFATSMNGKSMMSETTVADMAALKLIAEIRPAGFESELGMAMARGIVEELEQAGLCVVPPGRPEA